jgi:uncharacterized protein (TIGR02466 family)
MNKKIENYFIEIFKCPIFKTKLNIDNKILYNYVKKIKESVKKSNVGGWQSENLNLNDKELNLLIKQLIEKSNLYINYCGFKNTGYKILNLWANINKYKDFNLLHNHNDSIFSGAFYIKTPKNCGGIVFTHPSQTIEYSWNKNTIEKNNDKNSSSCQFDVEENILLLFPSWLNHYVLPNFNKKKERVSISFNIGLN